jgi:hypothetical protein
MVAPVLVGEGVKLSVLEPAQEEQDQEDDEDRAADSVVHGSLLSTVL